MDAEIIGLIASIFTTGSFVPQAYKTIRSGNTESLSLLMYLFFTMGVFLWLIYGIMIESKPIIFGNATTIILCLIILCLKIKSLCTKK